MHKYNNNYNNNKNYRNNYRSEKSTEQKVIEGFLKGLWWLISLPFRLLFGKRKFHQGQAATSLDQAFVKEKYAEMDQLLQLGGQSNFSRAVLEGDKLLDHVLKSFRAPGLTMGDRLKASKNRFSPEGYDAAWKAHKVRNEIVHNAEYQLMDYMAKDVINNFKKAIEELLK
ncbi:TPA: hypothetical protein DD449_02835 [Candidatus Berkelbacteria bacterium]|nr:hypothetical protein [Candidatus Berkelbacteria bacterium]